MSAVLEKFNAPKATSLPITASSGKIYGRMPRYPATVQFQSGTVYQSGRINVLVDNSSSSIHFAAWERLKGRLLKLLSDENFDVLAVGYEPDVPTKKTSRESAQRIIKNLPLGCATPRVSPDGEGDILLVWGVPAQTLVVVEDNHAYVVVKPGSSEAKHLGPISLANGNTPREILKYIPQL